LETEREEVFHVFGFAQETKTSDVFGWFSGIGKVQVFWKDDNSLFISVRNPEDIPKFVKLAETVHHKKYSVETLSDFRKKEKDDGKGLKEILTPSAPSTPPPVEISEPPRRKSRSSLVKKRPRPSSIGFEEGEEREPKKFKENDEEGNSFCAIC
jgi:hypothetical protein